MKNKRFIVFFVVILIALTVAACTRSAATPAPDGETSTGDAETSMDVLAQSATQTAAAQQSPETGEGENATEGETTENENQPAEATPVPEQPVEPEKPTPAPTQEYSVPNKYTLQKGEFPYCIARRFNISPGALLAANGLNSSSVTFTGQVLVIPKDAGPWDAGPRELSAHPTDYTVRAGDTVFSIACLFGSVDPRAIEDANGFEGAYTLQVGDVIHIP